MNYYKKNQLNVNSKSKSLFRPKSLYYAEIVKSNTINTVVSQNESHEESLSLVV